MESLLSPQKETEKTLSIHLNIPTSEQKKSPLGTGGGRYPYSAHHCCQRGKSRGGKRSVLYYSFETEYIGTTSPENEGHNGNPLWNSSLTCHSVLPDQHLGGGDVNTCANARLAVEAEESSLSSLSLTSGVVDI